MYVRANSFFSSVALGKGDSFPRQSKKAVCSGTNLLVIHADSVVICAGF